MDELHTREDFAAAISTGWRDYVANIFRAGWLFVEMRDRGNGALAAMRANKKLPMKRRTAQPFSFGVRDEVQDGPAYQFPVTVPVLFVVGHISNGYHSPPGRHEPREGSCNRTCRSRGQVVPFPRRCARARPTCG